MKYIGENAIKKLISLIKGDLATKQDSIAATGVLERDTTGVINGVETVGATLVETQEATLVDVPNGLLKGDGTTISAAVAGTDYVNSSQAIRYDAAQTLTDDQKTQARGNINAAPGGFGWGDAVDYTFSTNDEFKTWFMQNAAPKCARNTFAASVFIADIYNYRLLIIASGSALTSGIVILGYTYDGYELRATIDDYGVLGPWEWVDPPMQLGVEYRTTERYQEKPVYTQIINCGSMPDIGSEKNTSITAFNVDVVTFISGWCTYFGSMIEPNTFDMALSANTSNIRIENLNREVNSDAVIYTLVKYTKTTD